MAVCSGSHSRGAQAPGTFAETKPAREWRLCWGMLAKADPLSLEEPVQCRKNFRVEG
jgi:hypothetical protein